MNKLLNLIRFDNKIFFGFIVIGIICFLLLGCSHSIKASNRSQSGMLQKSVLKVHAGNEVFYFASYDSIIVLKNLYKMKIDTSYAGISTKFNDNNY